MLQRIVRHFGHLTRNQHLRVVRMPTAKSNASFVDSHSPTADIRSTPLQAKSQAQPRRSSRLVSAAPAETSHGTATANTGSIGMLAGQSFQQESFTIAQPAETTPAAVSEPVRSNLKRSRKRKAVADSGAAASGGASATGTQGTQAVSQATAPEKAPEAEPQAAAVSHDLKQVNELPDIAQGTQSELRHQQAPADPSSSCDRASPALDTHAHPPKSPKQRKPRTKAVIKTETVIVTKPAQDQPPLPAAKSDDGGDATAAGSSPSKTPRKQKRTRTKVEVKTETVIAAELPDSSTSAQDSAAVADASAKPKKPRQRKAKAEVSVETLLESVHVTPYRDRVVPKKWVGAHVSMGGGMERAVVRAAAIGANAFALDTRSKRQWESKPMSVETAEAFKQACRDYGFGPEHILPHGSYLINLASAKPELLEKSYAAFVDELKRCEMLGIRLYNFHPGSTCGECPPEESMQRIADSINKAHLETESVTVVLENMAGGGGSVGHRFDYLRYVIDRVENKARVGVCLDTCHLFAGGYDVSSPEAFEQVMREFEEVVGLQFLKGMHVNDSKAALGSKRDRHENVAKGLIGKDCFSFLMNDSRFDGIPLIMETPVQCHGPDLDFKLSLLAGAPVFKSPKPGAEEAGENTDKRDIAWLNSLSRT